MERLIVIRNSLPRDEAESTTGESVASAGGLSAAGQLSQAVSSAGHLSTFARGDVGSAAAKRKRTRMHDDRMQRVLVGPGALTLVSTVHLPVPRSRGAASSESNNEH
jgi:hypothetical protein